MTVSDIEQLRRWRTLGARHSEKVVKLAQRVLAAGGLGDEQWAVREQLAIAALDIGQLKVANVQLKALQAKFPNSPRADLLLGLKLEAVGDVDRARDLYRGLLKHNETNVSAHQRLIALTTTPVDTITALLSYLDTFYSDTAAWSLLAELYADQGAYAQSLSALGHVLILNTWDSNAIERAGETAYTMGDYQLALKYHLRATEMETPPHAAPEGHRTRAWWGVKMATRRLLDPATRAESVVGDASATSDEQLRKLDALATQRILAVGGAQMQVRRQVLGGEAGDVAR